MRISQIEALAGEGARIGLWGWGREGRAAYHALRERAPQLLLTLFCTTAEAADTAGLNDALLQVCTQADADALASCAVVIKSPGISPYGEAAVAAEARGARFIGGTSIWFAEHADAEGMVRDTVCITGTKGKSTSTSLLAHLLRAAGHRTALAGNIGLPLLEVLDPQPAPDYWAVELSSYQTGDVAASGARPQVAVVLNLFPEHLDWHGSHARYVADKLRLVTEARPRIAVLNASDPLLASLDLPDSEVRWFNTPKGWHLREDALYRGDAFVLDTRALPLPGRHNRGNLCAVLTAIEALGLDAAPLARHAVHFRPLPHRLQLLGMRDGIEYVNDSISTTPHASLAALECFGDAAVALLIGGHDRGVDWAAFVHAMRARAPAALVTMGQNGPRIRAELAAAGIEAEAAESLEDAMSKARARLASRAEARKVVLLSPGAPSFGVYRDYVERGRHFATLAGFDPQAISAIPGLGIA